MGDQATEDATRTGAAADGNDTIILRGGAASGAHTIMGGAGKDTITTFAGDNDERIDGGSGADVINGDAGQDTIFGRAGADTINITAANTAGTNRIVRAGADDDKITFDTAAFGALSINDTYSGEKGTDTIALIGTAADFDMSAIGSAEATAFDNVTAETFALGSTSTNELALGGQVTYTFAAQAQTSGFRTFDATHTNGGGVARRLNINASTYTSAAGVTISGSANGDVTGLFTGGSGADTLNDGAASTAAADTLVGGAGIDTFNITASATSTQISDLGVGGVSDIFTISAAANGANVIVTGNYVATAATSNNLSLAAVNIAPVDGIDVNLSAATGNFGFDIDGGDLASTLQGSAKADSINGGNLADSLAGNSGNDTINGDGGNDTVNGGAGNDTFTFTTGTTDQGAGDVIDGGTGSDVFSINAAAGASDASSAEFDMDNISNLLTFQTTGLGDNTENQTLVFSAITETTAQTVVIDGSSLDSAGNSSDLVVTNNAASTTTLFSATGGTGEDTIAGSNGADTISGGDNNDVLTGNDGDDSLVGGAGNDTLLGGVGNDIISAAGAAGTNDLTGGSGADRMTFSTAGAIDQSFYLATTGALLATEAGTTLGTDIDFVTGSRGDTVNTFVSTEDSIDFKDALLTNAGATVTAVLNSIAAGGVVADTNQFVEITTALADGTMGAAITQLNGLNTAAVNIGDSFIAFQKDASNGYLYLVEQVSAANTIAAQDVTLIGQLAGVTDIANTDLTTIS
jgi:Ca2+-binding RTX toxin-like protein